MALLLINKGPRGFLSLIAGVALYHNLLEDPLFFHGKKAISDQLSAFSKIYSLADR